ncbi:MAG: flagellar basal body-associated protein FliL [Acidimicrobiia bacterium]
MAEEEEEGHGKKGKEKPKKKKSNMVPAIVVALGMIVGGKMMGSGKAAPATAASTLAASGHGAAAEGEAMDCATEDILHPPVKGAVFKLEPQTLNLANGSYVKVTISLQLSKAVVLEVFKEEGEAEKAADVVLATISGRDKAEFSSPQSMAALKEKLTDEIRPKFECQVLDVLISQWVVQ